MAAHQYWRLTGFLTDSNVLELSQAQLYDGTQLIAQEPTFTVPPTSGTAFPDTLHWDDFSMPGFALVWDLSTPVANPNLRLGAGSSAGNFPKELYCQYSDDGTFWSTNNAPANVAFPGAGLLTAEPSAGAGGTQGDTLASQLEGPASPDVVISSDKKTASVTGSNCAARGLSFASSGVRQFEVDISGDGMFFLGVAAASVGLAGAGYYQGESVRMIMGEGTTRDGTVGWGSSVEIPSPCTLGVVVNFTAGTFSVYRNGAFKATVFTNLTATPVAPMLGCSTGSTVVYTLRSNSFVYPVAGATDWASAYVAPIDTFIPLAETPAPKRWRTLARPAEPMVGSPMQDFNLSEFTPQETFMDAYHGGRGIIRATVNRKNTPENTPLRRRVDLMDERSRLVIRSTWSDPATGIYAFVGIREDLVYTVVSYDPLHGNRAVIADNLTLANGGLELMP